MNGVNNKSVNVASGHVGMTSKDYYCWELDLPSRYLNKDKEK